MNRLEQKRNRKSRRVERVRHAIKPKTPRARLVVNRSNKYIHCQVVDDLAGKTLAAASTAEKGFSKRGKNKECAAALGAVIAERALAKGIKQVVLDRRGLIYHGRVAALADAAREKGLEF
ncbi:MAG: 50S ribosomal protein L18 [Leptospirales bacterium]|nr:50S ribosomal protein L18 [Leptospirales bacterium]